MTIGRSGLVVIGRCERTQVRISSRAVVFITTTTAIYSLGHGLCTSTAVPRSTQPSTLRGMVKWVSAFGLSNNKMVMVDVDDSSLLADSQPKSIGLVWGLAATWRWVCIHHINRVNFRNGAMPWSQHHKYRRGIIIIIIIIIIIGTVVFWSCILSIKLIPTSVSRTLSQS